jgi:Na+-transporting NADH:ubiquinone oxidoreductase subunit NqrC
MNEKKTNNIKKRKEKYQGAVVEERLTVRRLVLVPMTGTNLWHVSASHMNRHLCAL